MTGYIYRYTFPDGKVYIGQTRRHPSIRHREHISPSTGPLNSGFWEAYQKFGKYQYEIIETISADDAEELVEILNQKESEYICAAKAYHPDYGYNKKVFGTEHVRLKTDEESVLVEIYGKLWQEDEVLQERTDALYNAIVMKIFHTKEPLTEDEKKTVQHYASGPSPWDYADYIDLDDLSKFNYADLDEIQQEYVDMIFDDYLDEIAQEVRDEIWAFVIENKEALLCQYWEKHGILALDEDGNIIERFRSFADICARFGCKTPANVQNVLAGRQEIAYGYRWAYAKDYNAPKGNQLTLDFN